MRYALGFDGGGTKTECVLMDSGRQIRATTRSGPSNPLRVGFDAASSAIAQAAQFATREANIEPSQISAVCAGLAGVGSYNSHEEMERLLTGMFPKAAVRLITDLELSLEAARQSPAIVLVAGTGSAAIGRDSAGHIARAGGHGPLLSDQGSAYDVGRQAVAAAVRSRDRTGVETPMGVKILQHLKFSSWTELRDRARTAADEVFPRAFPVVAAAADAGDTSAQSLLHAAANEIAILADALVERLHLRDTIFFLGKTGGLIGVSKFFDAELDAQLKQIAPRANIGLLPIAPAEAAACVALELIATRSAS
jgi:N-acetylglucosamine kinase-like BadF-type ATPase